MFQSKTILKIFTSVFLFILISFMVIDATPETSLFHKAAKDRIDIVLDKTGLWQGTWTLFSPSPDKVNVKVSWVCSFNDGTSFEKESPRWVNLNIWEKWLHFRYMEYFDNIRNDSNQAAWKSFGRFIKKACETSVAESKSELKIISVQIFRHWATISQYSTSGDVESRPFVDFREKFKFFEERYE